MVVVCIPVTMTSRIGNSTNSTTTSLVNKQIIPVVRCQIVMLFQIIFTIIFTSLVSNFFLCNIIHPQLTRFLLR